MMNPRIDCSRSPLEVRLQPAEVVGLDLLDARRMAEWKKFAERFNGPVHSPEHPDEVYHCGGGINSFAIDPQGKMSIYVLSHFDTYDLRTGSFREGWEDFLLKVRRKKMTRLTKCVKCEIQAMCGMCPANGELENGHAETPVDFLCHVAHLRARVLGFPVSPHGECEYCEGGAGHGDLMRSVAFLEDPAGMRMAAGRLRTPLPSASLEESAAGSGCAGGGCSACGVAAVHGR